MEEDPRKVIGEHNPYQPPVESADAPRPTAAVGGRKVALYSPTQVVLATFLGTLLAGAIVMALNERWLVRDGQPGRPALTVGLGILATLATLGVALVLPEDVPGLVINLPVLIGMHYVANGRQGELYAEHLAQGGEKGSTWVSVGIGLSFTAAAALILFLGSSSAG